MACAGRACQELFDEPMGNGVGYGAVAPAVAEPSPDLQARAEEKRMFVEDMIRNLKEAIRNCHQPEEKKYLQQIIDPEDPCFRTLINLLTLPKYAACSSLRCVVLQAVQMILKVAVSSLAGAVDVNVGMKVLKELVGKKMAGHALQEICLMVDRTEQAMVACDAMLVLAELGPDAFDADGSSRVLKLMDLFAALPDRASDLVEVALRAHAWGGATRVVLLEAAVTHDGGRYLGEVLLQILNRSPERMRRLRAVKLYLGCFEMPNGADFLYTNDKRVLVEILMRELPTYTITAEFLCYADCYRALVSQCEAARTHQQQEALQVLGDLEEREENPREVREKCTEILLLLRCSP